MTRNHKFRNCHSGKSSITRRIQNHVFYRFWTSQNDKKHESRGIVFFLILISGIIIRIAALPSHDFWFDEALTYRFAKLDLGNLLTVVATDNNPPLYYILIHFLLQISSNEIFLRFPSFIAGVLTVAVLLKLSKTAAALFSVSPLAIYIGTEARMHSLAALFTTLSYFFFLKVLKKSDSKNIFFFVAITTLGVFTQYYLVLLLIPFSIVIFIKKRRLLWIFSVPLILLLPWLLFTLNFPHNGCWCPNSLISLPATLASPAIGGVGKITQRSFIDLPFPTFLLFSITGLASVVIFFKGAFKNFIPSFTYFAPVMILTLLGFFLPIFSPKGASVFSPFFFLISAQYLLKDKLKLIYLLAILMTAISIIQTSSPFFKDDSLKKISKITTSQNGEYILHTSLATFYSQKYYSPKNNHLLVTRNPLNTKMVELIGGQETSDFREVEKAWLVASPTWLEEKSYQKALENISNSFQIAKYDSFSAFTLYYLGKKH